MEGVEGTDIVSAPSTPHRSLGGPREATCDPRTRTLRQHAVVFQLDVRRAADTCVM